MKYLYIVAIIIAVVFLWKNIPDKKYKCPNCGFEVRSKKYFMNFWNMDKCYFKCPFCHKRAYFPPIEK